MKKPNEWVPQYEPIFFWIEYHISLHFTSCSVGCGGGGALSILDRSNTSFDIIDADLAVATELHNLGYRMSHEAMNQYLPNVDKQMSRNTPFYPGSSILSTGLLPWCEDGRMAQHHLTAAALVSSNNKSGRSAREVCMRSSCMLRWSILFSLLLLSVFFFFLLNWEGVTLTWSWKCFRLTLTYWMIAWSQFPNNYLTAVDQQAVDLGDWDHVTTTFTTCIRFIKHGCTVIRHGTHRLDAPREALHRPKLLIAWTTQHALFHESIA